MEGTALDDLNTAMHMQSRYNVNKSMTRKISVSDGIIGPETRLKLITCIVKEK
jgi:hypothetical protein